MTQDVRDLIAEARECAPGDDPTGLAVMVHRLVDVLEVSLGERDAAVAALDGAPESEWEWAVRAPGDEEPFSDIYQSRENLAEQETGIAWGDEQLVRRRKAGPWLPVEGESK